MKIMLLGKLGQLGWELDRSLQCLGQVSAYDYPEVDFRHPKSFTKLIRELKPEIVINAAAYTDVDKAETEGEQARVINAEAPAFIAETCRDLGAAFIHYSTDYVFDGLKGSPYQENDPPNPLNIYGKTKLEGERAVIKAGGTNLIFRTAWVYSLRQGSFVTKVLNWARAQSELRIVDDQVSNPTWARELAEITALVLAKAAHDPSSWLSERIGLYHLAGWGFTSRLEWGKAILRSATGHAEHLDKKVRAARTADFPSQATRPAMSALDCSKFLQTFDLRLPDWESALRLAMEDARI